eukprot:gb/GEZJ01005095.1/.p1 GENE.gb/GEZJ01005095.1/~~gb/GEZJ01005095.1/.p1  ORF type:complete len:121 (+),score=9.49 gb/GEZJ01005095.1/:718-1080(+)
MHSESCDSRKAFSEWRAFVKSSLHRKMMNNRHEAKILYKMMLKIPQINQPKTRVSEPSRLVALEQIASPVSLCKQKREPERFMASELKPPRETPCLGRLVFFLDSYCEYRKTLPRWRAFF